MADRVSLKPLEPYLFGSDNPLDALDPDSIHLAGKWQGLSFFVSQAADGYTHLSLSTAEGPAKTSQGKAFMRMWGVRPVGNRIARGRAAHWEVAND